MNRCHFYNEEKYLLVNVCQSLISMALEAGWLLTCHCNLKGPPGTPPSLCLPPGRAAFPRPSLLFLRFPFYCFEIFHFSALSTVFTTYCFSYQKLLRAHDPDSRLQRAPCRRPGSAPPRAPDKTSLAPHPLPPSVPADSGPRPALPAGHGSAPLLGQCVVAVPRAPRPPRSFAGSGQLGLRGRRGRLAVRGAAGGAGARGAGSGAAAGADQHASGCAVGPGPGGGCRAPEPGAEVRSLRRRPREGGTGTGGRSREAGGLPRGAGAGGAVR